MKDADKGKEQLIDELERLRQRIKQLKSAKVESENTTSRLTDSEIRYRRLFETAHDGILILHAKTGQVTDVNPFLEKMLGYSHEEFVGKKLWEIGPFKDIEESKFAFTELQEKGYVRYEHLPLQARDGHEVAVEFVSNVYKIDHTSVIQCNIRDITEHKQAEDTLRERFKELTCLYGIGLELQKNLLVDDLCHRIIKHLVRAMQFPDITAAVIELDSKECASKKYSKGLSHGLQAEIKTGKDVRGHLWVYYTEQRPFIIPHEQNLVNGIAQILGLWLERKQAAVTLQQSEAKHRMLFETMAQGIVYQNAEGYIFSANPAAEQILGLTFDQMQGRTSVDPRWKTIHEDGSDFPGDTHPAMAALKTGKEVRNIIMGVFHPGKNEHVWININAMPQFKPGAKKPYQVYATFEDITERKQAEEALKESEEKFRSLVESTSDWIWEIDLNGVYTYASPRVKHLLGYEPEEVVGKTPFDLMPAEEANRVANTFKDIIASSKPIERLENTCRHKNGHLVTLETSGVPVFDSKGQLRGYRGIDRDITERNRMMDSMVIADRLAALGNMAGGFAHEINNPLTSVIGYSQLLLDRKDLPEDIRQDLTGIHQEAQRASRIIKEFMSFALKPLQPKQPVDINDLIKDVLKLRQYEQKKANIHVKTNFAPDLPMVTVGPVRMRQVFMDIITNAEYFMAEANKKGILTITTEKAEDIVRTSLTDDGPGISPENLGQIFNPFFTTKEIGKGIGLGLSICHSIVIEHGGRIYVESEQGKRATFIVELPVNQD
jgi:PAS domain S-box-containing protein